MGSPADPTSTATPHSRGRELELDPSGDPHSPPDPRPPESTLYFQGVLDVYFTGGGSRHPVERCPGDTEHARTDVVQYEHTFTEQLPKVGVRPMGLLYIMYIIGHW